MSDLSSSAAPLFSFSAVPLPGGDVKFDAVLPCPGRGFPFGARFEAADISALSEVVEFVESVVERVGVCRGVEVDRDALLVQLIRAVLSAV